MATKIRLPSNTFLWASLLFVLLLTSLLMMSDATQNSARFSRLYSGLLLSNVLGLVILVTLIGLNIFQLISQVRERKAGARLTVRMVTLFILLSVTPVTVVYYFSMKFIHQGIDSWFDIRIENALDNALELSRSALDLRMRDLLKQMETIAVEFNPDTEGVVAIKLGELRERINASELTLLSAKGRFIASSSADATDIIPNQPHESALLQVRQRKSYIGLDPIQDKGLHIRIMVNLPALTALGESRMLQALFPVSERMDQQANSVQTAYAKYKELAYLRKNLILSFTLTLSLVLLFSIFSAVWAAFFSARRLTAPIRDLAEGTRAVAGGDYETQLPVTSQDDLGFLVASFNEMTRKIGLARDDVKRSQEQAEHQRAHLEAVLGRLSSGVLTIDPLQCVGTANAAAGYILGLPLGSHIGEDLQTISKQYPYLQQFNDAISRHLIDHDNDWREQVVVFGASGRQILMCRGTDLPSSAQFEAGHVVVFDDITALIQAQKNAAWSEVARRLAHEIKNPLTPIQLSAERLRHKYLKTMAPEDAEILDRLTHTIVQQVESMKTMVNTFSEYARTPKMDAEKFDLNDLIKEVGLLYHDETGGITVHTDFDSSIPPIEADPNRIRQVLHNLIKNAIEANHDESSAQVDITTQCVKTSNCQYVELNITDQGPGVSEDMLGQIFEPYVTTKTKGTGLGLAIVKKIIEEHGGLVWLENQPQGGVKVIIRLPVHSPEPLTHDAVLQKDAV